MNELGAAARRLVGRQPVRLRYQTQEQRFLLQDVHSDARVAALVRDKSTLQLCGPVDAAPLVLSAGRPVNQSTFWRWCFVNCFGQEIRPD